MSYKFREIEARWQNYWSNNQVFKITEATSKPKYYVLDMFPYPSGAGLHVGHPLGYIASDIFARYKRHKGYNVLHPMGFDSFGLPAEQYALETGQHPAITTETNITWYKHQLNRMGFSFDWSREVRTSDPKYYKWTQWIFIQLFNSWYNRNMDKAEPIEKLISVFEKNGNKTVAAACDENTPSFSANEWKQFGNQQRQDILLKYRLTFLADTEVNWCPALGTVLANDEVVNGVSERGGHPVVRKRMKQWMMRISAYAQRLLDGLETIDWPQAIKDIQKNWIGRSQGATIWFDISGNEKRIEVFSTRPDTLFGATFITLAPEHELVKNITTAEYKENVEQYVDRTNRRSERERLAEVKKISGVFTGAWALHPFTRKKIPIWIGDFVLAGYGTGAVMSVPCGDQRDYDFARHFNLPINNIFDGVDISKEAFTNKEGTILANSEFLNGLNFTDGVKNVIAALEKEGKGHGKIQYRLRDAVFSRQRYWGEPFPVYYQNGFPQVFDSAHLPLVLPKVARYKPTKSGAPPLGNAENWAWDTVNKKVVSNKKIDEVSVFPLELNTMPGWAGSSWYFYRYTDSQNEKEFASKGKINYWKDVDLYVGGSEHATGHLLYSRFWQHFLYDINKLPVKEFAKKLINQGMILGESAIVYRVSGTKKFVSKNLKDQYETDELRINVNLVNTSNEVSPEALKLWQPHFKEAEFILENGKLIVGRAVEKMSKRWHNVLNPDDICDSYGADTLRLYEMFLGPVEQAKPWNTAGISGVHSFLKKLWRLFYLDEEFRVTNTKASPASLKTLHKTIKKVEEDILSFSFNTAVSSFMICINELTTQKCHSKQILEPLVVLLAPFVPHAAEELWSKLGHKPSVFDQSYPLFEAAYLVEQHKIYPVSFNGKMRFKIELPADWTASEIEKAVLEDERCKNYLNGEIPKKIIVVPGKIVNIVV